MAMGSRVSADRPPAGRDYRLACCLDLQSRRGNVTGLLTGAKLTQPCLSFEAAMPWHGWTQRTGLVSGERLRKGVHLTKRSLRQGVDEQGFCAALSGDRAFQHLFDQGSRP